MEGLIRPFPAFKFAYNFLRNGWEEENSANPFSVRIYLNPSSEKQIEFFLFATLKFRHTT